MSFLYCHPEELVPCAIQGIRCFVSVLQCGRTMELPGISGIQPLVGSLAKAKVTRDVLLRIPAPRLLTLTIPFSGGWVTFPQTKRSLQGAVNTCVHMLPIQPPA